MWKVAIVGLPNSGKSTLFNRLTGRRRALVHRRSGMTRDRLYGTVEWQGRQFMVIDTGGVDEARDPLQTAIQKQVDLAVTEADLVVVLLDGAENLRPGDTSLVEKIRKKKPFIVAVNKIDAGSHEGRLPDFSRLGVDLVAVSADHGRNVDELLERIIGALPGGEEARPPAEDAITLTIVGRPNAGKSTLLNSLVGYERSSVSVVPGTTRDCVDAEVTHDGRLFRILDTAGIRKKPRIDDSQEIFAVLAARQTIPKAHCTLLLLDGVAGIGAQDRFLASEVATCARSAVVLVNKVDLAPAHDPQQAVKQVHEQLNELPWARVISISALTGQSVEKILRAVRQAVDEGNTRIPTAPLNRFFARFLEDRTPKFKDGVGAPIRYAVQVGNLPVAIRLFTTRQTSFLPSYEKMLAGYLRREFKLTHSPVRIQLTKGRPRQEVR